VQHFREVTSMLQNFIISLLFRFIALHDMELLVFHKMALHKLGNSRTCCLDENLLLMLLVSYHTILVMTV
jgi:hypothetical protein